MIKELIMDTLKDVQADWQRNCKQVMHGHNIVATGGQRYPTPVHTLNPTPYRNIHKIIQNTHFFTFQLNHLYRPADGLTNGQCFL